jgi:hypothetical protein
MEITTKQPEELKPHPMNPKLHTEEQIGHIVESIKRFGFTQPVVCDENYTILVGHARTQAAKKLQYKKIPVLIKRGLRESEKLALCLADNQIAAQTPLDLLKVEQILGDLRADEYETESLGLSMEIAFPEEAEPEEQNNAGTIKQIVIIFESQDFDLVMRKFDSIRAKEPSLRDNTEVFNKLLTVFEESCSNENS